MSKQFDDNLILSGAEHRSRQFDRNLILLGVERQSKLSQAHVLIVGIGGVGGSTLEMLVRAGVGNITVVDGDVFDVTNLNRQLLATHSTIGVLKTQAAVERAKLINPDINIIAKPFRFCASTAVELLTNKYDYVVDAIDSVQDKVLLITQAQQLNLPIISSMGAGNRLNADFSVKDIYSTCYDGLAKKMRKLLKENGVKSLKTICADCAATDLGQLDDQLVSDAVGSISYVPTIVGCKIAQEVIKDIICQ